MNPPSDAIQQALLLQRHPEILFELQQSPLPEGMAVLIRLVSDEGGFRLGLAQASRVDGELLRQAAASYLRSICLFPGSLGLRVLALNDASDMQRAKDHHRLLIKWLHPDRNPQNKVLAERVNQAWSQLKAKLHAEPASVLADGQSELCRRALPKSRFNWFIGGLAALSSFLLLLSLLPEQEVYVSGINADRALGATEPDVADPETNVPLASLRHLAWAEPVPGGSKQEVALTSISPRTAVAGNPVSINAISKSSTSRASAAPLATTQASEKVASGPAPVLDKPAAKSLPVVFQAEPKAGDAIAHAKPPITQGIVMADANNLLPLFISRYRQGDIESFMGLFSRDARNNRGDRDAIAEDYSRLFAGSHRRELDVSQLQWRRQGDSIALQARYRSMVRPEGAILAVINKGSLEIVFVNEGGKARIQRLLIGD